MLSLKNRIDDLKTNPENIKEPNLEEKKEDVLAEENISNILEIDEKQKINKEKEEILTQTSQRSKSFFL